MKKTGNPAFPYQQYVSHASKKLCAIFQALEEKSNPALRKHRRRKQLKKLKRISNKYQAQLKSLRNRRTRTEQNNNRDAQIDLEVKKVLPPIDFSVGKKLGKLPRKIRNKRAPPEQEQQLAIRDSTAAPPPLPPVPPPPPPPSRSVRLPEPTYQAMLLDRYSLYFELLKPNDSFRTLLWDCCVTIFQYMNDRRCGASIQRLFEDACISIPQHLTPTEFQTLLHKMGIKEQLSAYDRLWLSRCIGRLHTNGSLPIPSFDRFSQTFWHKTGRMQTVFNLSTFRDRSSAFTLSCLDHAVDRASCRITNAWDVQKVRCVCVCVYFCLQCIFNTDTMFCRVATFARHRKRPLNPTSALPSQQSVSTLVKGERRRGAWKHVGDVTTMKIDIGFFVLGGFCSNTNVVNGEKEEEMPLPLYCSNGCDVGKGKHTMPSFGPQSNPFKKCLFDGALPTEYELPRSSVRFGEWCCPENGTSSTCIIV